MSQSAITTPVTGWSHTVFAYAFRPFFLAVACYAVVVTGYWSLGITGWLPLSFGSALIAWHVHELVFGVATAALAGFLLTAVPEWTEVAPLTGRRLKPLFLLWLLARVAAWLLPLLGPLPMALLNLLFVSLIFMTVAPGLWRGAQGRHRVFAYLIFALWIVQVLIYAHWFADNLQQVRLLLFVVLGIFLLLILAALGRISMVIVNEALQRQGVLDERFIARPPRRRYTMGILALFLLVDYLMPYSSVSGWIALATAAALLNILNDWHLPGVWRDFYVRVLYTVYLALVAGFALIGMDYLWHIFPGNYARHILTVGALGLSIMAVLTIAGLRHTGRTLEYHPLIKWSFRLILLAMIARVAPPLQGAGSIQPIGYGVSALLWCGGFTLYLVHFWRKLTSPRVDGLPG
mgnify:CR=1 FL=1